ncbi:filamentous hemagglutinin N-terminal domain-containing protein [Nostoc sp. CHAB 5844]|nr:filamentous hemagglutinin N-terminal domain-containing protein [Nostoc sp. CHAB 5844]
MEKIVIFCVLTYLINSPVLAQIVPDNTLGSESSVVTQNFGGNTISGGATRGTNLFHSFQNFSVKNTVFFNNGLNIENIITRVTGGQISNINGLIQTNGTANLFLINPSGFIFGQNARLNVSGSFLASTANTIKFADGTFFSATVPQNSLPLLTITSPIGLNFESHPAGTIEVQGPGHTLLNPIFAPILGLNNSLGLQVQPGKTLSLVGGNVILDGGILQAGRIELGSVGSGLVTIGADWSLDYKEAQNFQEIQLSRQALLNTSGAPSGSIQVQGQTISISEGSAVFIQNQGGQSSGGIKVNADLLKVTGTSPDGRIVSTLLTETLTNGNGGDIEVSAKKIIVENGGQILPRTFGTGRGGNSTINASESIQVVGFAQAFPNLFSNISAASFGGGDAGSLTISTNQLIGINGIQVGSATFGNGSGGNVFINATDIALSGVVPSLLTPSSINAATFSSGNAGQVVINSSRVRLENGGAIDSSTTSSGDAGSVTVNSSNSILVDGIVPGSPTPSLIDSSALVLASPLQQQLRIPPVPTGNAGSVTVNTANLSINNGGLVAVRNEGTGNAGNINITANTINISNGGGISATTEIAEGGNIALRSNILQLNNGKISSTAGQQGTSGNGGNININADVIVGFNNNRITADAFEGRGGNITINTQGLFFSRDSLITAASQQGINGTVNINYFSQLEPANVQVNLPTPTPEIASVCQGRSGESASENKFVITGTGGLPPNPLDSVSATPSWHGNPNLIPTTNHFVQPKISTTQIIPAQGWQFNPDGTVTLIADNTTVNTILSNSSCNPKLSTAP